MTIHLDPLPPAPLRSMGRDTFNDTAETWAQALNVNTLQRNAQQDEANTLATRAETAAASAQNAPGTNATSTTSLAVGSGAKTLTIQTGKAFVVGQFVMVIASAAIDRWMVGQITAYDSGSGSLTVNVVYSINAGTYGAWTVTSTAPYVPITAQIGYTPANKAGDTFTGNVSVAGGDLTAYRANAATGAIFLGNSGTRYLYYDGTNYQLNGANLAINNFAAWHSGNDGAGSGLDAGLFAGQLPDYYTNIIARLGFTPINKGGDTFTGPMTSQGDLSFPNTHLVERQIRFDGSGRSSYFYANSASFGAFDTVAGAAWSMTFSDAVFRIKGQVAWHAGNDGAGSGLDAGLFAGQPPSYYTDVVGKLGYVPVNPASPNLTNDAVIAKSGNVALTLNSLGVVIGRLVAQTDGNIVLYRSTGGAEEAIWNTLSGYFNVNRPLLRQGYSVFDAGNDGPGSALDADTVDGYQAAAFMERKVNDWVTSADGKHRFYFADQGATHLCIVNNVIFQNQSGANVVTIDEAGNLSFNGNIGSASDARLKSNVRTIDGALDMVGRMRGVRYEKDGREQVGVIAQEMREVLPEVVMEGDDPERTLSVTYQNIIGVLIEAVKDLNAKIDHLKEQRA